MIMIAAMRPTLPRGLAAPAPLHHPQVRHISPTQDLGHLRLSFHSPPALQAMMQRTTPPPQAELTVAPAAVTAVYTPAALVEAVAADAQDVEVRGHLDLRTLESHQGLLGSAFLDGRLFPHGPFGFTHQAMRSMRVRSRHSPSVTDTCGADATCVSGEARVCTAIRACWTVPSRWEHWQLEPWACHHGSKAPNCFTCAERNRLQWRGASGSNHCCPHWQRSLSHAR